MPLMNRPDLGSNWVSRSTKPSSWERASAAQLPPVDSHRLFEPRGRNAVVVTCATVTIPIARDPRADRGIRVATGLRTTGRRITSVDPTSNGGGAWCKVLTHVSTRLIPYLTRMTSETEG